MKAMGMKRGEVVGEGREMMADTGTEPPVQNRGVPAGMAGSVRNSTRDKNVAVLSRNSDWDGSFRPERDGINNLGLYL